MALESLREEILLCLLLETCVEIFPRWINGLYPALCVPPWSPRRVLVQFIFNLVVEASENRQEFVFYTRSKSKFHVEFAKISCVICDPSVLR